MSTTLPPYYVLSEDAICAAYSASEQHGDDTLAIFFEMFRQIVLDGTHTFEPAELVRRCVHVVNRTPEHIHECLAALVAAGLVTHTRLGYAVADWNAWQELPFAGMADRSANHRAAALRRWHEAGNHTTPKAGCELCGGGEQA